MIQSNTGDTINDAPYILEPLIEVFDDEPSHSVRMELLTATMKLFFKRPPELKAMLGKLLQKAIADVGRIDVRDRAMLYYRLLKFDVHEAARVVNCPKNIVESFVESEDKEQKEKIFQEFNTLTVVYGIPAEKFLAMAKAKEDEEEDLKAQAAAAAAKDAKERADRKDAKSVAAAATAKQAAAAAAASAQGDANAGTYAGISIPGLSTPTGAARSAVNTGGGGGGTATGSILPFDAPTATATLAPAPTNAANILVCV